MVVLTLPDVRVYALVPSQYLMIIHCNCLLLTAIYRNVPNEEEREIICQGSVVPQFADNAEALIDWALSHIPKRMSTYY